MMIPDGVVLFGSERGFEIKFDTFRFAPDRAFVDDAKKEIANLESQGLKLRLKDELLDKGIIKLIVVQAESVGDKIIRLVMQIIDYIGASNKMAASIV